MISYLQVWKGYSFPNTLYIIVIYVIIMIMKKQFKLEPCEKFYGVPIKGVW